jgi:hypothetical protein
MVQGVEPGLIETKIDTLNPKEFKTVENRFLVNYAISSCSVIWETVDDDV